MTACQSIEHAGEIRFGVEVVQLCALDDRVQDCRAVTTAIGTEEQKILARDSDAPQQSLRQIVVDAEPAVVDLVGQGIPAAQPVHHHGASDPGIEFHCEHPSSPSMPGVDIEKAYQDRYTLAPPPKAGSTPVQWYTLPPLFITPHGRVRSSGSASSRPPAPRR